MKRTALGFVLAATVLLIVGQAPAALAHTELILSTPEDGALLGSAPEEVVLAFSEEVLPDTVQVSVTGAEGAVVTIDEPLVEGSDVTVAWPADLPGPDYAVNYRVVSKDGHPVTGTITFTVTEPAESTEPAETTEPAEPADAAGPSTSGEAEPSPAGTPVAATAPADDSGLPTGAIAAIVAGLILGVGVGVLLISRRASQ